MNVLSSSPHVWHSKFSFIGSIVYNNKIKPIIKRLGKNIVTCAYASAFI